MAIALEHENMFLQGQCQSHFGIHKQMFVSALWMAV